MEMNQKGLAHLATDIFATQMHEIQCDEADIQMVLCADALLSDEDTAQRYPQLWHHLRLCADCAQEYRMLMELAQLEAAGKLVQPTTIPPLPDETDSSLWTRTATVITALFPGFGPDLAAALTRGESLGTEPVEIAFADGAIVVVLDVDQSEQHPTRRDLFCRVDVAESALEAQLESQSIWLRIANTDAIVQEQMLDELGDAFFASVEPGTYDLHLRLVGQEYIIQAVDLP